MPWKRIITPTSLMGLLENATPNLNALTWAFCVMRSYIMARPQARRCMTIWRENVLWFINSASWGFEVAESMQDSCLQPRDSRHHKGVHFRTWAVRRLRFFPNQKIGRKQKWSRDGFLRMLYRFFRWYYESTFPFHEACYRVLARHMGYQDPEEINKDILHEVMCEYSEDCLSNLELDFGGLVVQQFWNCTPGEEVCSSELTPRDVIIDSISILCTVRIQISDYCRVFLAYCL